MSALPFRRSLMLAALGTALTVGACSRGGKSEVPEITVEAASLDLSGADARALERHFQIKPRRGNEADTLAVLEALGLAERTEGRTIDGATAAFADWSASDGDTAFTADRLVLRGLHMVDGQPVYDALDAEGIRIIERGTTPDAEDDTAAQTDGTLARLVVVEPTPDFAAELAAVLRGEEAPDTPNPLRGGEAELPFRALRMDDADIAVNDPAQSGSMALELLVIGNDDEAGTMDVILDSVSADLGEAGAPGRLALSMDGLTALDLRVEGDAGAGLGAMGALSQLSVMAPSAEPPYREIDFGAMALDMAQFGLRTDGFEADSAQSGSVLTLRSVLKPTVVTLKDATGTPLAPFMDTMRENGLAEVTFKGSQTQAFDRARDRVSVSDARLEIDEGLRMDCDYQLGGLQAAANSLDDSGVTPPEPGPMETEEQIDAFLTQMAAFQEAQAEASALVTIDALDCTVQDVPDNSLVTRGYAVASDVTGRPVAVLKGGAKTMIALSSLTAQSEFQRDLMDSLGSGLIDFIDTPGQTMRITVAPDAPVSITSLSGPDASLKPLGLTVTVE